ncbi:MAG: DUF6446 family protein [Pseudomonadota bacterium]
MSGRAIAIVLIASGLVAGVAMYWLQVYAFYRAVELGSGDGEVTFHIETDTGPLKLDPQEFQGIDADSSPIRFRACFRVGDAEILYARGIAAEGAVPLNAPRWFNCFDAAQIGADLQSGEARALIGQSNAVYGIDRVLAVYPDGRAFAWDQINRCGQEVFDGNPPPVGCPLQEPGT